MIDRRLIRVVWSVATLSTGLIILSCSEPPVEQNKIIDAPSAISTEEDASKRIAFEVLQLIDPVTGRIPTNIHRKELSFSRKRSARQLPDARVMSQEWDAKGPANVGGRTRALALDVRDENIVIAGGVSGGVYRSSDLGSTWSRTTHPTMLNNVTCIAQDTRPAFRNVWYYGTGELQGNSTSAPGAPFRGDGIYRSQDGGMSWDAIPSTSNNLPNEFESPFNYIWNIVVSDDGSIYAAIYGCVVRSIDAGDTWEVMIGPDLLNPETLDPPITDINDSSAPYFTNVFKTSAGAIYATLSAAIFGGYENEHDGIYYFNETIDDFEEITPPGFTSFHNRTVMADAVGDEGPIFFYTQEQQPNSQSLWKLEEGGWFDLSFALPGSAQDTLPVIETQGSYNMVIKVHPENQDVVFVGGTNLFRSTNGFVDGSTTRWIGGYDPNAEGVAIYPGHHPDQHQIVFLPSDPDKMLSANDGGVRYTSDNLADEVSWTPKNDGYVTSQFFTIALSKVEGSLVAIGGLQDNGTYLKLSGLATSSWESVIGGDGSFTATTPEDNYWYASFQEGQIFRLTLNDGYEISSFAQVTPEDAGSFSFINPFVLDPNNYNRMYMPAGNAIWRNDNLSQIPSGVQEPTSVNWSMIESTDLEVLPISALDISTVPANILYFGTSFGTFYKTINAHTDTAETFLLYQHTIPDEDGELFSGFISNVAIDPTDANKVLFSYSNYNFPSLFYSEDGGETIEDVSGDLEENPDGSGGGPSVRWNEIVPMADGSSIYFTATSTGLYSTTELNGNETRWVKEGGEVIGNAVIRMTDYRYSDGRFIVATHGNGVFETTIENQLESVLDEEAIPEKLNLISAYPNPFTDLISIQFEIPEDGWVSVEILNASGQLVTTILDEFQFAGSVSVEWDASNIYGTYVNPGMYFYRVRLNDELRSGRILYGQE